MNLLLAALRNLPRYVILMFILLNRMAPEPVCQIHHYDANEGIIIYFSKSISTLKLVVAHNRLGNHFDGIYTVNENFFNRMYHN